MPRRVMTLSLSGEALVGLLSTGPRRWELVDGFLPEDARFVDIRTDAWRGQIEVLIESAHFPEVGDNCYPPYLPYPRWRIRDGDPP